MKALSLVLSGLLFATPAFAQQVAQGSQGYGGTVGGTVGGTIGSTVGSPMGGNPVGSTMGGSQGSPAYTSPYPYAGDMSGSGFVPYGQTMQPPDGLPGIPYPADGLVLTPARPGYENDP